MMQAPRRRRSEEADSGQNSLLGKLYASRLGSRRFTRASAAGNNQGGSLCAGKADAYAGDPLKDKTSNVDPKATAPSGNKEWPGTVGNEQQSRGRLLHGIQDQPV